MTRVCHRPPTRIRIRWDAGAPVAVGGSGGLRRGGPRARVPVGTAPQGRGRSGGRIAIMPVPGASSALRRAHYDRGMTSEIEIGRSKRARRAYSFDDIALVPARRTRDVRDVRVGWQLDAYHVDLPVMASPMDSVMSPDTAILVGRLGGIGVLDLEGLWTRYEDTS